ncbi:hypothetical protein C8R44DRAFT_795839 [Mycena epipterygia]|nr:hypothetical protein C8R44DRAFT_795839 [Mycena epipterygia]
MLRLSTGMSLTLLLLENCPSHRLQTPRRRCFVRRKHLWRSCSLAIWRPSHLQFSIKAYRVWLSRNPCNPFQHPFDSGAAQNWGVHRGEFYRLIQCLRGSRSGRRDSFDIGEVVEAAERGRWHSYT